MQIKVKKGLYWSAMALLLIISNLLCYRLSRQAVKEQYDKELTAKEQEIGALEAEYELKLKDASEEGTSPELIENQEEAKENKYPEWEKMMAGLIWEPQTTTEEEVLAAYEEFLNGERTTDNGTSIYDIVIPTGEPDKRCYTEYAYYDLTGDGLPELALNIASVVWSNWTLTYRDGEVVTWHYQIADGGFDQEVCSNGDIDRIYLKKRVFPYLYKKYIVLNKNGEEVWEIPYFCDDLNRDEVMDPEDTYCFDDVEMSSEDWNKCIEKLPALNELEWIVLFDDSW